MLIAIPSLNKKKDMEGMRPRNTLSNGQGCEKEGHGRMMMMLLGDGEMSYKLSDMSLYSTAIQTTF